MQTRLSIIPNMARMSNVLMTILVTQLLVSVYWLLADPGLFWVRYGLWSFYWQWLVMLSLLMLQVLRRFVEWRNSVLATYLLTVGICLIALLVVEIARSYYLSGGLQWLPDARRFWRIALADVLMVLIVVRAFDFMAHVKALDRAESTSRITALQARIQPHFLFNSLNTIAELTVTSPEKAEEAIHALAMLFRVSLEDEQAQHSLAKEITLCRRYIELESWRVSGGLHVSFDVTIDEPDNWAVPKLILQPLLENAIKFSRSDDGVLPIELSIKESRGSLSIKMVNHVTVDGQQASGHGIAVQNIKDRLFALYEDKHKFSVRQHSDEYHVLIQLPKVTLPSYTQTQ